jgi:RNA polymerase sigma-70 factor (ECF subfamily)
MQHEVSDSDAQLLRRAREDPEALGELYLRYRDQLYLWFRARVPESAASELTAELFAQVAVSLRRFRDEAGGSAGPWLYGIAKNLVRRYHERGRIETAARRRLGMPIKSYELDLEEIEGRLASEGLQRGLRSALESLPKGQRDALELRIVAERDYQEIAAELGCSETAARLRVMRALGKLARLLRPADA